MSCITCGCFPCGCTALGWPQAATGPACECPTAWWGLYPPPCPVHNPPVRHYSTAGATGGITPVKVAPLQVTLTDEDIERIAQRLKQLLDTGKSEP